MGFKNIDLTPIGTNGPTVQTPTSKDIKVKAFQALRTDTSTTAKAMLPASASVLRVSIFGGTSSNAGTSATVTITLVNNTGTISTGSYDVKNNGTISSVIQMTALPNIEESFPSLGDIVVNVVYAETGTASNTGGPWTFMIEFVS